jgi:sortase A
MVTADRQDVGKAGFAAHTRGRKFLPVIQRVLLTVGILLVAIFVGALIRGELLSRTAMLSFEAARRKEMVAEQVNPGGGGSRVDFSLWSDKRINAYKQSLAQHFDPPLAVLRVPKIHLDVPILEGTDDLTLNRGVGWIVGTARVGQAGNIGIAGHRDGFFRGLKDVGVGDRMDLELANRTETYVVDSVQIVTPEDVSVLRSTSKPSLTLVTCYPFYFIGSAPKRYIIHASIVHSAELYSNAVQ